MSLFFNRKQWRGFAGKKNPRPPAWAGAAARVAAFPNAAKAGCFASPGCGCALTLAQIFARTVCTRTGPRVTMHVGAARA